MSAELSVTVFILTINVGLFLLAMKKERFADHPLADFVVRRGIYSIAIFLGLQNVAIVATIAESAGLDVVHDLFNTYLFLFGVAGYVFLLAFVIGTIFQVLKMYRLDKNEERMGYG